MILEKHDRQYNLLFYSIAEEYEDPLEKLRALSVDDLNIDMTIQIARFIVHAYRKLSICTGIFSHFPFWAYGHDFGFNFISSISV